MSEIDFLKKELMNNIKKLNIYLDDERLNIRGKEQLRELLNSAGKNIKSMKKNKTVNKWINDTNMELVRIELDNRKIFDGGYKSEKSSIQKEDTGVKEIIARQFIPLGEALDACKPALEENSIYNVIPHGDSEDYESDINTVLDAQSNKDQNSDYKENKVSSILQFDIGPCTSTDIHRELRDRLQKAIQVIKYSELSVDEILDRVRFYDACDVDIKHFIEFYPNGTEQYSKEYIYNLQNNIREHRRVAKDLYDMSFLINNIKTDKNLGLALRCQNRLYAPRRLEFLFDNQTFNSNDTDTDTDTMLFNIFKHMERNPKFREKVRKFMQTQ